MKTYTEYEPGDIDLKADPLDPIHSFLMVEMLVIGITGFKPAPGDPEDEPTWPVRRAIAVFLNHAQKAGISITKSELPAAFTAPVPSVPA